MHEREGGQHDVVAGDYSTYNGLRIGLLARHTYNDSFKEFAKEKGFDCEIIYYETPTELTDALINDEVDALVNSYIRILEDESVIENFGQTPYYIMARREDQDLIDQIDNAIDCMNPGNIRTGERNCTTNITVPRIRIRSSQMRRRSFLQSFRSPVTWMSGWMWTAATIRKEPLRTKPQILI